MFIQLTLLKGHTDPAIPEKVTFLDRLDNKYKCTIDQELADTLHRQRTDAV